jgi:hypothetical protein
MGVPSQAIAFSSSDFLLDHRSHGSLPHAVVNLWLQELANVMC